ncbi:hypothetical protein BX611_0189 [Lutibacter oceani]|uniref:Uncharacterized protein n=1 Tax=Lutibacter oceani TaxID=1853311 RepID=A0A3D9RZC5_9FLAO|nr:hypothetical protein BX611_0189 [Lutibacter oceani]
MKTANEKKNQTAFETTPTSKSKNWNNRRRYSYITQYRFI